MTGAPRTVVLAAGGTGGHMFPAESLARELNARGHRMVLVTDRRGADHGRAIAHLETHVVRAGTLARGVRGKAGGLVNIVAGVLQARSLLPRLQPHAAVGFGGYPSLPTMLAAARLGIPAAIHEQNAVLGRVNRLLVGRVAVLALSFEHTRGLSERDRARASVTGNPVRAEVLRLRNVAYAAPRSEGPIRLLVFGGSQGATSLSRIVPEALAGLDDDLRRRLRVAQQCRPEDLDAVRGAYTETGIAAESAPFFADLPARMAEAHLVIARAGASTVTELAAIGRPALLVPYPHATDDHQTANADALSEAGGAWTIGEHEFTVENLVGRLNALLSVPHYLEQAAASARRFGRVDAVERLADLVEGLAGANGGRVACAVPQGAAA